MAKRKISLIGLVVVMICVLVFAPVVTAGIYFIHTVSGQLQHTASETVSMYLNEFTDRTDRMMETLRDGVYYLTSDSAAQQMMSSSKPLTQIQILQLEQNFSRAFSLGDSLNPDMVSAIYLIKNDQYVPVYGGNYYLNTSWRVRQMYQTHEDCNSARTLYTHYTIIGYAYMIVDFVDLNTMQPLGKIIVELNINKLLSTLSLNQLYPSTVVIFSGAQGKRIGSLQTDLFRENEDMNKWYHASSSLRKSRERVDIYIPNAEILAGVRQSTRVYFLVCAAILILALLLAATCLILLLRPLRQMLHTIGSIGSGDFSVRMDETPYTETTAISHAFNDMADRLDTLFQEVYQRGLLLRDAEIHQLESQIQPHFIFNILELINVRCMVAGQPAICTTVQNLAQLLRASVVNHGKQIITLQEELDSVKYYLALQKERFEEKLQYTVDVEDDKLLGCYLPKLTIQPLIENSIVHGLEPKRHGGWVRVSIWEEEDAVYIRVHDDGVGFDPSAIRKGLVHCIHWGDLGCEIAAQADDGMMALEQIPVIQPNIVISDIRMPGMDGLELAEIIARDHPGIKVIILTGYPDFAYAQRAIQYHVVDFVLKPMTVENLTNAIEKAKAAIAEDRSSQDLQEKLSTTSARNMELQQSMLLHDLIHRVACSQLYVLNRLAQLKMDLRSYFVLKLHITSLSEEALTEEEYNEYLNQSQEILSDCLSSYQHYYIARGTQDCFVVICAAGEAPITALCREAVNIVGSLAHFLLFIGISNCNDNPICLADAADEAAQAVRFTVFTPDHPVTHFAELSSFPQQLTDEIFEMLSALKSAMELRNPADTEQLLDCIFAYADSNKLPPDTVRNICVYIHQFGMELQFPGMAGHSLEGGSISSLKRIMETNSIAEMESCTRALVQQTQDMAQSSAASADHIVSSVQAYISAHYGEQLSLDQLAQQFYLSSSYLSRLFKRETGTTLTTYLQNVRIEAAKNLLRTTALKSYEVAERVGINDPVYFSRIFKKITGLKPKDYRHSVQNESSV